MYAVSVSVAPRKRKRKIVSVGYWESREETSYEPVHVSWTWLVDTNDRDAAIRTVQHLGYFRAAYVKDFFFYAYRVEEFREG